MSMTKKILRRQTNEEQVAVTWRPDWMSELPEQCCSTSLTSLAIPGSHNALSIDADMRVDLKFSPYNPEIIHTIRRLPDYPIFSRFKTEVKEVWKVWGACQSLTVFQQLELGVRYLDLRIAKVHDELRGEHGLYTRPVTEYLQEIADFLTAHPKEVAFLHFQNLNNLEKKDLQALLALLQKIFQSKLCPPSKLSLLTLQALWQYKYQVLVFMRQVDVAEVATNCDATFVWTDKMLDNSRKDIKNIDQLQTFLSSRYQSARTEDTLHIIQGTLCPDLDMVFGDFKYNTRKELCKYEVNQAIADWTKDKAKMNILATDFVEFKDVVPAIIQLNYQNAGLY